MYEGIFATGREDALLRVMVSDRQRTVVGQDDARREHGRSPRHVAQSGPPAHVPSRNASVSRRTETPQVTSITGSAMRATQNSGGSEATTL